MERIETVGIIAVILFVMIAVAWTWYQWELCMKLVGDSLYCLAHIS